MLKGDQTDDNEIHDAERSLATALAGLGIGSFLRGSAVAAGRDTIKVGILHSLSGTMAISETTLKDTHAVPHR